MFFLPSLSSLSRSACRFGSSGFAVRPSSRGLGGFVAAVGFRRPVLASEFARYWAAGLPRGCNGCVLKRKGGFFWVSVPVWPASVPAVVRQGAGPVWVVGSPPACRRAVAGGGVWSW